MDGHIGSRNSLKESEESKEYDLTVAIVGNPNVGKSTLFNVLTGKSVHVANWPGVTVESKEGVKEWKGIRIRFVDLPGIYGLSSLTLEEVISREYIVSGDSELVIGLVDATSPERSLYLPIQLLELTPNVIIVFTKVDEMNRLGIHIHFDKLEAMLGVPVIPTSALHKKGIRELLDTIINISNEKKRIKLVNIDYGGLESFISDISKIVAESKTLKNYPLRWASIRLLEGDKRLEDLLTSNNELDILNKVQSVRDAVRRSIGRDPAELIINARFRYVSNITKEVVVRVDKVSSYEHIVDKIFRKPYIGAGLSLVLMLVSLLLVFSVNTGFPLNLIMRYIGLQEVGELIEFYSLNSVISEAFNMLSNQIKSSIYWYNPLLASLISDGIVIGLGSVISFLPLIFMTFLILAALEDSGLAPRIAISFHNLLNKFGYSGNAVYPLILGMGCNVPAVMSSRTSVDDSERTQMIFSAPFIPCQARLIVASALIAAFFRNPLLQALALLTMYLSGIFMYLLTGKLVRRAVCRISDKPELILELPLIHFPKVKVLWWIAWDYTKHFLKKAGLIIFTLSVLVWVLVNLSPSGMTADVNEGFAATIGNAISYILIPFDIVGEDSWKIAFALIQGFIAKESVLQTLAVLGESANVDDAVRSLNLTIPQAYSLILLITLYIPCLATVAVVYQESRNLKLTVLQTIYMTLLAYLISILVYQLIKFLMWVI
ncbi:MAG: ferrous iron transport protein B [Sulfolobales archaeon]|nr:ferrous iron transport protein B [Sulfolobales archaeon]